MADAAFGDNVSIPLLVFANRLYTPEFRERPFRQSDEVRITARHQIVRAAVFLLGVFKDIDFAVINKISLIS